MDPLGSGQETLGDVEDGSATPELTEPQPKKALGPSHLGLQTDLSGPMVWNLK